MLTLRLDGRRLVAEAQREVRGVVISRQTPPLAAWLELLAGQLHALAAEAAGDAAAVTRTLSALGVAEPASDLAVDAADVPAGLRALPLRLADRVPPQVVQQVERITGLLADTLPRVAGVVRAGAGRAPDLDRLPAADPAGVRRAAALLGGEQPPERRQTPLETLTGQLDVLSRPSPGCATPPSGPTPPPCWPTGPSCRTGSPSPASPSTPPPTSPSSPVIKEKLDPSETSRVQLFLDHREESVG